MSVEDQKQIKKMDGIRRVDPGSYNELRTTSVAGDMTATKTEISTAS